MSNVNFMFKYILQCELERKYTANLCLRFIQTLFFKHSSLALENGDFATIHERGSVWLLFHRILLLLSCGCLLECGGLGEIDVLAEIL